VKDIGIDGARLGYWVLAIGDETNVRFELAADLKTIFSAAGAAKPISSLTCRLESYLGQVPRAAARATVRHGASSAVNDHSVSSPHHAARCLAVPHMMPLTLTKQCAVVG
jgi:hypothetical protein